MLTAAEPKYHTPEAYLILEKTTEYKHEYRNGKIIPMKRYHKWVHLNFAEIPTAEQLLVILELVQVSERLCVSILPENCTKKSQFNRFTTMRCTHHKQTDEQWSISFLTGENAVLQLASVDWQIS
jgi:hypothetical protein